ncbi:MAG: hypothetical protein IKY92_00915 [Akkermansia sp.]|nr:hypothetical protein [Akkermansia sp.]
MSEEDEKCVMSQNASSGEMRELKVELQMDLVARLTQQAAASGMTLEQLVAQTVRKLAE